jgi:16S rRNA (cytosine1402-N4)-methyltransferase
METNHEPVLVEEVLRALGVEPGDTVIDATLGGAGHFKNLLAALGEGGTIIGIDADPEAVERAREAYGQDRRPERPVAHLINDNFRNIERILDRLGLASADAILFDLGWSAYQLGALRGFSFAGADEPLLMTYGPGREGGTAAELVNSAPEEALADIIARYGEERFARGVARAIVTRRGHARILTVGDLVEAVHAGTPAWYHKRRIHPATKTFQALRIAVNDEFGALADGLSAALRSLAPGGRLAVITFHSLEDRIVKKAFRDAEQAGRGTASKKPVVATRSETTKNRRARSAKLRVFMRAAHPAPPSASAPTSIRPTFSRITYDQAI